MKEMKPDSFWESQVSQWNAYLRGELTLSVYEYMKLALYGPDGYYTSRAKIGGAGRDFFTSASFSLFAKTLANASYQLWDENEQPAHIQVVEWGAGEGTFAQVFIPALLKKLSGEAVLTYIIEETSKELQQRQRQQLQSALLQLQEAGGNFSFGSAQAQSPLTIVIGNEILDAVPVERVKNVSPQQWVREKVQFNPETGIGELTYEEVPEALREICNQFLPIPVGHIAEVEPTYYSHIFQTCNSYGSSVFGWFFDYGIHSEQLKTGIRPSGTLRGYREQQHCSPFISPGQIDITADVVWNLAVESAKRAGFTQVQLKSQRQFLLDSGITEELEQAGLNLSTLEKIKQTNQLKQLVFPGGLGDRFDVLCFKK